MKHIIKFNFIGEIFLINIFLIVFFYSPPFHIKGIPFPLFCTAAWFFSTFLTKHYYSNNASGILTNLQTLTTLFIFYFFIFYTFVGFFHKYQFDDIQVLLYFSSLYITLIVWRIIVFFIISKQLIKKAKYQKKVIIIGLSTNSVYLKEFLNKHSEYGYKVMGIFTTQPTTSTQPILGDVSCAEEYALQNNVSEIICSLEKIEKERINSLIRFAENNCMTIKFIPDLSNALGYNYTLNFLELIPLLSIINSPFDDISNRYIKRTFDIGFSLFIILFILSWLMPIIAILVLLSSRGPVFFVQKRSGLNNAPFNCFKFRTMRINKDSHLKQASKHDSRITTIGAFLRKSSLDELPQFFNVLFGSMSIVGPRPHMLLHTKEYSEKVDRFMARHTVKPGITGLSQILGYRGETEKLYLMKNRVRLDRFYIDNWTFYLDLKIIYYTVLSLFCNNENVY
jgi:putative colanic acid biosysnthesis UDP-glucose lipid carrier transferase